MAIASATEQAFLRTNSGAIEVKTLPACTVIKTTSDASYFEENNLFMPLFWYITTRGIAMTSPVEVEVNPGTMYFYIGGDAKDRALKETDAVEVERIPERLVASIGYQGAYTEANFQEANNRLKAWLKEQKQYRAIGEAKAIYWDGPSVPKARKRAEVHIELAVESSDA